MATSMSSNKLVWVSVGVLALLVIIAVINSSNEPEATSAAQTAQAVPKKPTAPAADGDTVAETLRGVQARYEQSLTENTTLKNTVTEQEKRLQRLEQLTQRGAVSAGGVGTTADGAAVDITENPLVLELQNQLSGMQKDFKQLSQNLQKSGDEIHSGLGESFNGYDLGWGDEVGATGGSTTRNKKGEITYQRALPGYVAVRPMTKSDTGFAASLTSSLGSKVGGLSAGSGTSSGESSGLKNTLKNAGAGKVMGEVIPHYTIPARGTIFEARAMTALIGTVPVGGKVQDPFPAKFIVGEKNLATNGLRVPGLKGIVFEGVARGNWNLSCVAITVTAATYTFADGRIQHMTYNSQGGGGGSRAAQSTSPFAEGEASQGVGYISNPQGVPCIPGKRITDAHKQLFTIGTLGAAASYFDAKAAAETTSSDNALGGGSTSVTGNRSAFINNTTYSNSVQTIMDFYSKRMRDTFDVIYRDPGAEVSIHLTQDLLIDYHTEARKLAYNPGGQGNGRSLD